MYSRLFRHPKNKSFFLFGPRATGKSSWIKANFKNCIYLDLLESDIYQNLLANPKRLSQYITSSSPWVIIDEVQKVPEVLNEVHRLIENEKLKFILTGSSARKLKSKGTNLLAGRAITKYLFPLTTVEAGKDFNLPKALKYGMLPSVFSEENPREYLKSYVTTFLKEEVQQEGLTRSLGAFSRFLEAASFSQGCELNISDVARDCAVERKTVESYFYILEDLLLARRLSVFSKRAKRKLSLHPKFYFFDAGVFRAIRPSGPLDSPEEIDGAALETIVFQELLAINEYFDLEYEIYFWRTADKSEVDFILYGPKGIVAIEVKRSNRINKEDLVGLKKFTADYPNAKAYMLYGGSRELNLGKIKALPIEIWLPKIIEILK